MTDDDIAKARATIETRRTSLSPWLGELLAGWSTALDEVERLRGTTSSSGVGSRVADAIRLVRDACVTRAEGESVQLIADEVERLTKLLAEKHAQTEHMCAEIERLDGETVRLLAQLEACDDLCAGAAATVDALAAVVDRVSTIAWEAFGPFPVQDAEANLTAIEQGIAAQRIEISRLRENQHDDGLAILKLAAENERLTKLHGLAAARCKAIPPRAGGATGAVTLREGDASWHDGPGWYYTIDDYPDEGSCGAFAARSLAAQHAKIAGYTIADEREIGGEG